MHSWVTSHSYLKALVADGAVRCGLDDQAVEAVDPQHQAEARKLIAAVDAAKAKRAAARSSPEVQEEGANDLSRTPPAPTAGASCAAG